MNNFARTSNNRERLQQKSLFKRALEPVLVVVESIQDKYDYYKWPKSSGTGKIKCNRCYGFNVELESIKRYYKWGGYSHKYITRNFKKPVLPGKIIYDCKEYWRVIKAN